MNPCIYIIQREREMPPISEDLQFTGSMAQGHANPQRHQQYEPLAWLPLVPASSNRNTSLVMNWCYDCRCTLTEHQCEWKLHIYIIVRLLIFTYRNRSKTVTNRYRLVPTGHSSVSRGLLLILLPSSQRVAHSFGMGAPTMSLTCLVEDVEVLALSGN